MSEIAPHDWFRPKLSALIAQAEAAGIARDVAVAVVTDIINGPQFNVAPLQTEEHWNQDIGEPDYLVNVNDPISAEISNGGSTTDPMPFIGGNEWI